MSRDIRPLDLDQMEQRLHKCRKYLEALLGPRMPPNYLGTPGAIVTLARARKEIGYTVEFLKTALSEIDSAREDSGAFKIANQ